MIPHYNDIVECERLVMKFFDWNINFTVLSPLMFLEAFLVHDSVQHGYEIGLKAKQNLDLFLEKRVAPSVIMTPLQSHKVAAYALYKARDKAFAAGDITEVWPIELNAVTRVDSTEIGQISRQLLKV